MSSKKEIERITNVYRGYASDARLDDRRSLANPGNRMILHERWRVITELLGSSGRLPLGDRRILDVGCGYGSELARFVALGANAALCCGVDLIPERIEEARQRYPALDFRIGSAERLDFTDNYFDLVVLSTVFSSILESAMRRAIASEVARVLMPGGAVLWYDIRYPSPTNRNVRPVSEGQLRHLFSGFESSFETVTLLPPLARRLKGRTAILYSNLAAIPFLRSHLVGLMVKPTANLRLPQGSMLKTRPSKVSR